METTIIRPDMYEEMVLNHHHVLDNDIDTSFLKLRIGDIRVQIDFALGTIDVFDSNNRVCVNTHDNCIVTVDIERDID